MEENPTRRLPKKQKFPYYSTILLPLCNSIIHIHPLLKGRSKLVPKETKRFVFTFRSEKEGMFFEEWVLETDPIILVPKIQLNGIGLKYNFDEEL